MQFLKNRRDYTIIYKATNLLIVVSDMRPAEMYPGRSLGFSCLTVIICNLSVPGLPPGNPSKQVAGGYCALSISTMKDAITASLTSS